MALTTIRQLLQLKGNDVWSISPDSSVFDALRMMADKDVGALVVCVNDKLVGIISERDYARKVILVGKASVDTLVSEIMTRNVFTLHPDQTIEEAMALMSGVISIGDVVGDIIHKQRETIKEMERYVNR